MSYVKVYPGYVKVKSVKHVIYGLISSWLSLVPPPSPLLVKKILFIYLFLERGEGREKERERGRETSVCVEVSIGCLLHVPNQEPGPHPRYVPWPGIKPATCWATDWWSIHWATSARAPSSPLYPVNSLSESIKSLHILNINQRTKICILWEK